MSVSQTYNIRGKILIDSGTEFYTPITITVNHECSPYTIDLKTVHTFSYTIGGATIAAPVTPFLITATAGAPAVPSHCFTYSLVDDLNTAVAPIFSFTAPTLSFSSNGATLTIAQTTTAITVPMITETANFKVTSDLTLLNTPLL